MSQDMNAREISQNTPQFRSTALVAVGSNTQFGQNSLSSTIDRALWKLRAETGVIRAVSRYFSTPAFPEGSGPDFVNAAFEWASDLSPAEMIAVLHDVEAQMGRVRADRWGARTMDLDLIAVGQTVAPDAPSVQTWIDLPLEAQLRHTPDRLLLPHPRVQDRAFVLVPLSDIAPDWRHPLLGQTVLEMRDALPKHQLESVKPLENRAKRP